jgi:hypothetical protein
VNDTLRYAIAAFIFKALTAQDPAPDGKSVPRVERSLILTWLCLGMAVAMLALIGTGIANRSLDVADGATLMIVVFAFAISLWLFLKSIESEGRITIESNWGGLGGGLGGWRLSRSLVFLGATAATFAVLLTALNQHSPRPDLRERYRAAINLGASRGVYCQDRGIVQGRLVLTCTPPASAKAAAAVNEVWDQIKLANPRLDDIEVKMVPAPVGAVTSKTS